MKFKINNAVVFTYLKAQLIMWAAKVGIDIMGTECQRFLPRQEQLYKSGDTWTLQSDHLICCAEDFDVVENGRVIKDGNDARYARLAAYWKSLNPGCYHYGPEDARHFGYRPTKED